MSQEVKSPSSAAYHRYVSLGRCAIATVNIFPMEIVEIIRSYTAHTRAEFYHFVLKHGNVLCVSTCDKEHLIAFFIDETLIRQAEQTFYSMINRLVPESERHLYHVQPNYEKITVDSIFEDTIIMVSRIILHTMGSSSGIVISLGNCSSVAAELVHSVRESFSREADRLMAMIDIE